MTVLLNIFDVLPEDEEAFMQAWDYSLVYFSKVSGFLSVKLHRQVRPRKSLEGEMHYHDKKEKGDNASYRVRFFNYVEWETAEEFENAVKGSGYFNAVEPLSKVANRTPQLFELIRKFPETK